jgi:ADP-ribose pyrophosphatase YjhB (NUDIX family)
VSLYNFAYFQVAAKAIVQKGDDILLLVTSDGYYDFPGGRMDESEIDLSLHDVLSRELREELGDDFKFDVGQVAFVAKRRYDKDNKDHRILATFFEVTYKRGTIKLSDEHAKSRWVNPESILDSPEKFISRDEYEQYKKYCNL